MAKAVSTEEQVAADAASQNDSPVPAESEQPATAPAAPTPSQILDDVKVVVDDLVKQLDQLDESPGLNFIKQKFQEARSTIDREIGNLKIKASMDVKAAEEHARRVAAGLVE